MSGFITENFAGFVGTTGRTLSWFVGHTRRSLVALKFTDKDIADVEAELQKRGRTLPEGEAPPRPNTLVVARALANPQPEIIHIPKGANSLKIARLLGQRQPLKKEQHRE